MQNSKFSLLAQDAGIVSLMEDLGEALNVNPDILFLGGGNPASIPAVTEKARDALKTVVNDQKKFNQMIGVYQSPRGSETFIDELVKYFKRKLGRQISASNVAITSGSQSAFFILLNLFAARNTQHDECIVFPMMPEYLGYASQLIARGEIRGFSPKVLETSANRFKYAVDFETLDLNQCAALCVSRPTNPTGNVLTAEEVRQLSVLAKNNSVPFILDCAYGSPFPGIEYCDSHLDMDERDIQVLSLSKLGFPGLRTAIVLGPEEIIAQVVRINTVMNLANGNPGPSLMTELLRSNRLDSIVEEDIRPFYTSRRAFVLQQLDAAFAGFPYLVHEPEGAFFVWVYFPQLSITSTELYQRLKEKNVLVMDGAPFFFGMEGAFSHANKCVRLSYCQSEQTILSAITIIANEVRKLQN